MFCTTSTSKGGGQASNSGDFVEALETQWTEQFSPLLSSETTLNETKMLEVIGVEGNIGPPARPIVKYGQEDQRSTFPIPKGAQLAPFLPTYVAATIQKTAFDATQKAFGSIRIGALSEVSTEGTDNPNELTAVDFALLQTIALVLKFPVNDPQQPANNLTPVVLRRVAAIGQPNVEQFAPPTVDTEAFQIVGSQVSRKRLRRQF